MARKAKAAASSEPVEHGFTPGPWRLGDALCVKTVLLGRPGEGKGAITLRLCSHEGADRYEANARLMAAGPAMYEFIARKAAEGDEDAATIITAIHG